MKLLLSTVAALGVLGAAGSASALVTEPDGMVVPLPLSEDLRPYAGNTNTQGNMSLDALFKFMGEPWAINDPSGWQTQASADPQVFSPLCGFSGRLLMRGGGCQVNFGWYNAIPDQNQTRNPDGTMMYPPIIYPLLTTADYGGVEAFYPRVPEGATCTDPPTCTGVADWAPLVGIPLTDIRNDPNYMGGLIGFAVQANPAGVCSQSKFSQHNFNVISVYNGQPWISAIVYKSDAMPNSFYIAIEDLPVAPDNFKLPTPQNYLNDGDFNDFVYLVTGVTCEGGGTPCSTGSEGACGFGLLECLPDGTTTCVGQFQPSGETCDNIDNDCNGKIDDGSLCDPGFECFQGTCVGSCSTGEFPCPGGLTCDDASGKCVDLACVDVTCADGQICIQGQCLGGCEGVQCPLGQRCQLGRCVDPCASKTCPSGQVCEGGICVEHCSCRVCPANWACAPSGNCVVAGCETMSCGAGTVCIGGTCYDACEGVTCPGGATCTINAAGRAECGTPVAGFTPDPSAPSNTDPYAIPEVGWTPPDPTATGGTYGGSDPNLSDGMETSGCGCRTTGADSNRAAALALLGLGLLPLLRRRRR